MISKPVKSILNEFDTIISELEKDNDLEMELKNISDKIELLKLWRDEIESDVQSIFVIGKTSTGKSEFHNFLLDTENKKDILFKTSTKVETGIIQTLQHCNSKSDSFAEFILKDLDEFNKLIIPNDIDYNLKGKLFILPLNSTHQIGFFRDNIIAKNENNSFNLFKSVLRVNINYPLKYFKYNKIIDTPGLASSISETDNVVRINFHGKSNIFWFLDASKRTMSDNLSLLVEEKELVKNSIARICFIANKFDLMEYDDDDKAIEEVIKRKEEITNSLKVILEDNIQIESVIPQIAFTSFKKPSKKLGNHNTIKEIINLEEDLILNRRESKFNNITSLVNTLASVLKVIKIKVIQKQESEIQKKINKLLNRKKINLKDREISIKNGLETEERIKSSIKKIESIKKEKSLNTHVRYNKYLEKFKIEIRDSTSSILNSVKRIENIDLSKFHTQLNEIRYIKDLSLKEKEGLWKKYFDDPELDKKKIVLDKYVKNQLAELKELIVILNSEMNSYITDVTMVLNVQEKKIIELSNQKKNIESNSTIINKIKTKINNINIFLLEDIEDRVAEWKPKNSSDENKLISFLELHSLISEHDFIKQKIS